VTWLLCDYGQVLSLPQPAADRDALVRASGLPADDFWKAYWADRAAYDRAEITSVDYWTAVLGSRPAEDHVRRLNALDTASWLHPNTATLAAAERAAQRGFHLAILSNAPIDLADALDHVPWLASFEARYFSCRLHLSKPDPAIYEAVIAHLGARPEDIIFLDDRADNVAAAAGLGILAHIFTQPAQIDALPELYCQKP
jgi:putative hydrolase of the HAD superfamily